jgi:hypothetical protein
MSIAPLGVVQAVTGVAFPVILMTGLLFGTMALAVAVQPVAVAVTVTA